MPQRNSEIQEYNWQLKNKNSSDHSEKFNANNKVLGFFKVILTVSKISLVLQNFESVVSIFPILHEVIYIFSFTYALPTSQSCNRMRDNRHK